MDKYLEFDIVVHQYDDDTERMENMGITPEREEKIVKYCFDATDVIEIRQTFVNYLGSEYDAVAVSYNVAGVCYATPPLLISYNDFKIKYDEYYKKGTEVNQGGIL